MRNLDRLAICISIGMIFYLIAELSIQIYELNEKIDKEEQKFEMLCKKQKKIKSIHNDIFLCIEG